MMKKPCLLAAMGFMAAVFTSNASATDESKLSLSVEAGIEYDDNVSVSILDQSTGQSDSALVIDFSAGYNIIKTETDEVTVSYDFYQSLYDDLDDYDLQIHTLTASGSWVVNELDPGLNYSYSKVSLGGDDLYDSHTLTPVLGFSGIDTWYHQLSYGYTDKDFSSLNERDGDQHSIAADNFYLFMDNKAFFSAGLRLENEDTDSPEYDYQGIYLKLGVSMPLASMEGLKFKGNYQHYWRDYDNETISIGEKRDDEQDFLSLELSKVISQSLTAKFNYEYTNTDSNLPSADSEENVFKLSVKADF